MEMLSSVPHSHLLLNNLLTKGGAMEADAECSVGTTRHVLTLSASDEKTFPEIDYTKLISGVSIFILSILHLQEISDLLFYWSKQAEHLVQLFQRRNQYFKHSISPNIYKYFSPNSCEIFLYDIF